MRYKLYTGSLAWLIHRASGILLTLYLCLHLYILSHLKDPDQYRSMIAMMQRPIVKIAELGLMALLLGHGLNGLRLTLIDLGASSGTQKRLFWSAAACGSALCLFGFWRFIGGKG